MQFKLSHKLTPRWGTAIKHYRQSKGLSVSEFSTFLGVSKQAVYYWEKNQREAPSTLTWAIYKELKDKPTRIPLPSPSTPTPKNRATQ